MSERTRYPIPSRREFLKGVGAAGAGLVAGSIGGGGGLAGSADADVRPAPSGSYARGGCGAPASSVDFGRIFPNLPPFAEANDSVRSALIEVGQQGGGLDAQDDLTAGPQALIVDPTVNGNPTVTNPYGTNPDNPTMTAGSTFVGQFTDHDITFDQTSQLGVPQNPVTSPNTRTPALDLDSVFGGGPGLRPDLYVDNRDGTVGPKLKIGSVVGPAPNDATHEDVPRVANGDGSYSALLGDPRNDENVMIAGLHCAHILLTVGQDDEVALAKLERALDVALAANLPARAGTVYINIAGEFAKRQEWPLAEGYLRAGIRYCREHGLEPWVRSLEAIQAEMELTQGRWDAAADAAAAILDTSGPLSAEPRHSALSCSLSCEHVAATPSAGPCSTRHARSPSPQANSR